MNTEMSTEEFDFHKGNRRYMRAKVTRKCNAIKSSIDHLDPVTRSTELLELKNLASGLASLNEKISSGIWIHVKDRGLLDQELESIDEYTNQISSTLRLLEAPLIPSAVGGLGTPNTLKLPQVPLPEYCTEKGKALRFFLRIMKYLLININ